MYRSNSIDTIRRQTLRAALGSLLLFGALASGAALAGDSPSIRHTVFMRGQILEVQGSTVVVCIGDADGAKVGQELDVVRHSRFQTGPKGVGRYKHEVIGKVRIETIVDEHYAEAAVISGKAGQHDSIELLSAGQ